MLVEHRWYDDRGPCGGVTPFIPKVVPDADYVFSSEPVTCAVGELVAVNTPP
jgi:hypothetical protein